MRFGVLGPLAVWAADGTLVPVPEVKVRALLAALLARHGEPVSADRLLLDLWGDDQPANPLAALQTKVSRLRRAIGPGSVESGPAGYRLRGTRDADEFAELLAAARDAPTRARVALLTEALGLWRGAAFADVADDAFAGPVAHGLGERRLEAVELLAEARLALGDVGAALAGLTEHAELHPLRERLRAAHLRALYLSGRQAEALSGYAELRDRLADELGVDPGPELTALHESMLRRDPRLRVTASPRTNLPAALTELVGREHAVRTVRELLTAHRLVTLTGPGGVGKTSLAHGAAEAVTGFPDGVWSIDLTADAGEVAEVVARVLHVRDESGSGPATHLADALRDQRLLLVLDNCEHVVAQVAELVARLLRAAPGVRVLATSREPLGVPGERLEAVPPLTPTDAVRLLTTRAEAAGADLTTADADTLTSLCLRLDRLPLALELAAPRLRLLDASELLSRMDDRFRLLTTGSRIAPARQRTLRAVIDWSWELLTDPERVLLRRLAVHAGGSGLVATEHVSADASLPASDVLDVLSRLVDRSLVMVTEGPRYRLPESIGEYAVIRLSESGELADLQNRHLSHYLDFAEQARLRDADAREWLPRLDRESANLSRALDTAVRTGDLDRALRLVHARTWYWFLRGRLGEAERRLEQALALPGEHPLRDPVSAWLTGFVLLRRGGTDAVARRTAIEHSTKDSDAAWFLGFCLYVTGGDLTASAHRMAAVSTADPWLRAASLVITAFQAILRGELRTARELALTSRTLFDALGDAWGRIQAMHCLAFLAEIAGDYPAAVALRTKALDLARQHQLWLDVVDQQTGLARLDLLSGNHSAAEARHRQASRLAAEHGYQAGVVHADLGLALGARRTGDLAEAEAVLHRILSWHEQARYAPGVALATAELGFIAELRGDAPEALSWHTRSRTTAEITGDPRAIALALEGLAGAYSLAGDHDLATTLLAEAAGERAAIGAPLPPAERYDVDRVLARLAHRPRLEGTRRSP
ncbi:BTAD domain-containing putative transcriptional regulator [Amycolatopsis sp. QT-25]|uniref:BTAD domain-containing putative transcriptional regulator n=1 Tax=Amycolatopsis sp. QT-25 TaxID=3034022 RepID=UPI0023ED4B0B|nr:BTAD domain-containing putative transcriptional regulator [Amycolatopsis sp. QT-25]WET81019.1 BTAD domain-containing putative transcriptional regulator [Amycolatopsis sp. QT-25]